MSNNEAKFLLNAYRPGGRDAEDPTLAAALAQAKADPVLGAWFAREQAHDAAVAGKLREIAPPAGLRDAILAGGRATERAVRPAHSRLRQWFALAAGLMLLIGAGILFWPGNPASVDPLATFALNDVVYGHHGGHGAEALALQARLSAPDTHLADGLPVDFTKLANTGCRTLSVGGHKVLEICFTRAGGQFHCYIARAGAFPTMPRPEFVQKATLAAADWVHGGYHYVVVGEQGGIDAVKRLL